MIKTGVIARRRQLAVNEAIQRRSYPLDCFARSTERHARHDGRVCNDG
ncbi:MAG: hypothetical protein LBT00_01005 [Spirochaetaceae bacterium]|nr:hypothetical protein [Spirochaetaceae bacterium]